MIDPGRSPAWVFADWAAALAEIPEAVRRAARRAIFDTIAVMVAGGAHPRVAALGRAFARGGPCTVAGLDDGGGAHEAALINGMAAHVWDFDDTSYTGIMHGSAVVFAAALAVAEERGADEEALLRAFVAGSEITYTLADMCTHHHYFRGWWSTATLGLAGAAAAACKLRELDAERSASAISLAAAAAGGGKCLFGSDGKAFMAGDTAARGVDFACAAEAGLTAPNDTFEHTAGFFSMLNNDAVEPSQMESLGRRWRLTDPGLFIKTSPVCSAAGAAIEQTALLMRRHSIDANAIRGIVVEVPELVAISLPYARPASPQQAQFCLPYAVACAVLRGRVRLGDLSAKAIAGPRLRAMMDKVVVKTDQELSSKENRRRFPESARVTFALTDGDEVSGFCGQCYGMPGRPMTDGDLTAKANECMRYAGKPEFTAGVSEVNLLEFARTSLRP